MDDDHPVRQAIRLVRDGGGPPVARGAGGGGGEAAVVRVHGRAGAVQV